MKPSCIMQHISDLHVLKWNQTILWAMLCEFHATFYWEVFIQWFNLIFFHPMVYFFLQTYMFVSFLLFEIHRLTGTEETVRAASKRLTQGMADFNKAISSAKTDEEKTKIVSFCDLVDSTISWLNNLFSGITFWIIAFFLQKGDQQTSTRTMRSYNNILAMTQVISLFT